MTGLTAVEPERRTGISYCEAPLGERCGARGDRHETRIDACGWRRHDLAWRCEGRLGDSVVLGLKLERDGITDRCIYSIRSVCKRAVSTDNDGEGLLSRYGNDGSKSNDSSRETHFFQSKAKVCYFFGMCVLIKLESRPAHEWIR